MNEAQIIRAFPAVKAFTASGIQFPSYDAISSHDAIDGDPTTVVYNSLVVAFDFLNVQLFNETPLPRCLITMQRHANSLGFFSARKFRTRDGGKFADEIGLNPAHFHERGVVDTLSTLLHEMAHAWQFHHGRAPSAGYHVRQWAACMRRVGLIPSDTGKPDGKETGKHMDHYIEPGGRFEQVCAELLATGWRLDWGDCNTLSNGKAGKLGKSSSTDRVKYSCPQCRMNAWGKPNLNIVCGDCLTPLQRAEIKESEITNE